jgi:hypothetical protein
MQVRYRPHCVEAQNSEVRLSLRPNTEYATINRAQCRSVLMPIAIDTSEAPSFIRFTLSGAWPTHEQQRELRLQLIGAGQLTAQTRAMIDLRDVVELPAYAEANSILAAAAKDGALPRLRAYLVGSAVQYGLARQFKSAAGPAAQIGIFTNEHEALEWLWNTDRHS